METEKIISTLKEKIGTTSLSDRTISDYVGNNLPADGTEPDDAYFDKHANILKSLSGNFNADVAKWVEEFKKSYKPTTIPPKGEPQPTNDFEARLQAIEEANNKRFEALKLELANKDKALLQKSYISQLESTFKAGLDEKGLIYDPIYFEHIVRENGDFDTAKSIDEAVKGISEKYDKMFKDRNRQITSNGFISEFQVQQPQGAVGGSQLTPAEAFKARMRDEGYLPGTENK
jgi:hypothetical protein